MSSDPRLNTFISGEKNPDTKVQIVGFPSDEGVARNGGRTGASAAPSRIYKQLLRLTPHAGYAKNHIDLLQKTFGFHELNCSGDVETDQEHLGDEIGSVLKEKNIPIILGGGHETSYGHFLGYVADDQPVSIINVDAHADVRNLKKGKAHSGSPFRQAIVHPSGICSSYSVFGLNPASVSQDHFTYVNRNGTALYERDTTRKAVLSHLSGKTGSIMVTMDMDAVNQAQAPGVSAPNASGIASDLWLELAFEFGKHPGVTSFDLCEVNPEYDRDDQTVKLAALTIWYFLLGVSLRD